MKKYLLDTNMCIHFLKGECDLNLKIDAIGIDNCYISEITLAELQFGVENSAESRRAVSNGMVMVTRNVREFGRIEGIELENWIDL